MLIMGLDTALQRCSVAILRGDDVLADKSVDMERGHAEHLAPMAALAVKEAGVTFRDLDRVGVVIGPGGFTGVRVALAFARGLGIGTGIDIIGVTSLAALAAGVEPTSLTATVIDARRGEVFAALYGNDGAEIAAPFVSTPEQSLNILRQSAGAEPVTIVGSGAALLGDLPDNWQRQATKSQIDAKIVAQLALAAPRSALPPAPLYLRVPDAKPGKPGLFSGSAPR
ncbi:tRNA (adenosine(37)-N6)-threonylcarbamoyltransferase complex dimerization subunit type 1 TsaB [Hyphococcus lacteus]|uniref:tRNA (Adenosine(37)-N6)-threonylcarbamoyltransferase complex dimerization subunit type 1 TsaB n=1 Tax=Hyphococcus lacteus TaxID=3143536 RepID=A0ABV3Z5R3_9PROT